MALQDSRAIRTTSLLTRRKAVGPAQTHRDRSRSHTAKRAFMAFSPYKGHVAVVLLAICITAILNQILPLTIPLVFDDALAHHHPDHLFFYSAIMIVATLLASLIGVVQTYLSNIIGQRVMRDFRSKLYAHLQDLSLHFFTSMRAGEIQSRLSNDVSSVQNSVTDTFTNSLVNFVNLLCTVIAMFYISPLLTLLSFSLLPPFLFFSFKVGNTGRASTKAAQQSLATLNAIMQDTLSISGVLLIKLFGRKKFAREQFEAENRRLARLSIRQHMVGRWFFMSVGAFSLIAPVLLLTLGGWSVIYNPSFSHITIGDLFAFIALQERFFGPVRQLLVLQVNVQSALAVFDRIFEYLDLPIEVQDAPDAIHLTPAEARGEICFKHVSFSYRKDKLPLLGSPEEGSSQDKAMAPSADTPEVEAAPASSEEFTRSATLRDISFHIRPGQLVALVGPSGSGKTTITYLISRLYDTDEGSVEIDGYNVKRIAVESLGELIGVVTQDSYLFHATIRENLLYVRSNATDEEMIAATKAAAIHDRIMTLDEGYDTMAGERGYRLSGGEKQRLAIARVLLKDPRILILDEATSALDTHSERLVQAALKPLMQGRTTIAIAHRLSTILAADLILVLDKGEIVERGTHQELLAYGGLYATLYNQQFVSQEQESTTA